MKIPPPAFPPISHHLPTHLPTRCCPPKVHPLESFSPNGQRFSNVMGMEEFVRRLIHEKRAKAERRPKPSEAFARHFGKRHGVDLPPPVPRGYKPLSFAETDGE